MKTVSGSLVLCLFAGCGTAPAPAPAPVADSRPLVLTDETGKDHDVDALLAGGKSVTLVFWQTWCTSCRAEGPALARAARSFADKIEFFGVVSGPDQLVDAKELRKVSLDLDLPYTQIRDRDGAIAERFGVQSTPTIIVLGRGNRLLYRGRGLPPDWEALAGT